VTSEDDGDDTGHVDLERDVCGRASVHATSTIRFAYCTGIRRWACSTNTTKATIDRPTSSHEECERTVAAPDRGELRRIVAMMT